jgi:serine/threonine protein kinase/Tol biopolymer transport system component
MTPADRWQQIESLYHAARELQPADRPAFLADSCAGDPSLKSEVESLLAHRVSADGAVDDGVRSILHAQTPRILGSSLIGQRIGVYHVTALLGAGGMGEVYRARDTKLGRDVAIKILPRAFTNDPGRLKRFEREARMLAALNHPNIGAIYGLDDTDGLPALVLELVEGDTLEDRVRRGPLALAEALAIAQQIADALDTAHGAGYIHRDLKPSNIKITPEGVVKVLDFGLAKACAGEASPRDLSKSPTLTGDGTNAGVILGTAAYMSPEQTRGQALDKRTDIWAFGCVLYEMLTGRLTFAGETFSDTIVAILEREPDWTLVPTATPSAVRRLVQRCLEKNPRRRLRDIGDARHAIEDIATGEPDGRAATSPHPGRLAGLLGGVALAATILASWLLWGATTEAPSRNVQLQRLTDLVGIEESPAISPDGKSVAFVARAAGKRQIWQRLLAGGAPLQITRDDTDHEQPRWVPDSTALIYYVPSATPGEHGAIWEVPALGGEPRRITSALGGGDISHDGRRIALFRFEKTQIALAIVNRDGSGTDHLRPLPPMSTFAYPRWSPDDRWIAFQQENLGVGFDWRILVVPATPDGEAREIARSAGVEGLSWLPSGAGVVYGSSSGSTVLYPPTFNLRSVGRDGTEDRQLTFGDQSYVEPDVHMSGMLAASRTRMQSDIWKYPVSGTPAENTRRGIRITHQTGHAQTPSISPDESEVVYLSDAGGHGNLWIARTDGSGVRQITFERDPTTSVGVPMWSPAGDQIVFILTRPGGTGLSLVNRDGSGLRQLVTSGYSSAWSVDGQWVYYSRDTGDTLCIEKIGIQGGQATSIRCDNANSSVPTADGSVLYFVNLLIKSNGIVDHEIGRAHPENGPSEVLARVAGSRVPVARRSLNPVLSPDGRWLTFPLTDGGTTNIFGLPTNGEPMRRFTDFGDRSVMIARRVSWSPDNQFLYAAVADTDADIVLLTDLLR